QVLPVDALVLFGGVGLEQRREALMQLRGDEIEPLLQLVALEAAAFRRKACIGLLVGEVLDDRWAFGENLAAIELQRRDVALAVDFQKVTAAVVFLCFEVHLDQLERQSGLAADDVGEQRTGSG